MVYWANDRLHFEIANVDVYRLFTSSLIEKTAKQWISSKQMVNDTI